LRKKSESDCQRSYSLSLSLSLFFMWAQLGSNRTDRKENALWAFLGRGQIAGQASRRGIL